ncbi:MAG: transglycosylase SLT domain-containing protein [Thermodesulfobacteriota bacterium]
MKSILAVILFGVMVVPGAGASEKDLAGSHLPPLISSLKVSPPLSFCGEKVPLEVQDITERLEKELLLSLWDRPQVLLWLKRSRRYLPIIEHLLQENGVPDDLKFVSVAESALRPHVSSQKAAIGFWQFLKDTGLKYGLTINEHIDERRNVSASTQAAIRYFEDLHDKFGTWTLAAAAFNMGEEALETEIQEQEADNYYRLYLPIETQRFIFRILSVKLICSHPEQYGFFLSAKDYYPPLKSDKVQLNCARDIPIRLIAQAAYTYFKIIKDLNPHIRGYYLPKGNHDLRIPKGMAKGFHGRYQELVEQWLISRKEIIYIVKRGDNLSLIADKFGVSLPALLIWNKLNPKAHIYPGDRLIVYKKSAASPEGETMKEH